MTYLWLLVFGVSSFFTYKFYGWQTWEKLGQRAEVNFGYTQYPMVYAVFLIGLFLLTILLSLFSELLDWYFDVVLIVAVHIALIGQGSKRVFDQYRKQCAEAARHEDDVELREFLLNQAESSDADLVSRVRNDWRR